MEHASRPVAGCTAGPSPRSNRLVLALLTGLLAALGLTAMAVPASAHAALEETAPRDGAELATAPDRISFTFGEDLIEQGNAVTLTAEATGERLALAAPEVDGEVLSVAWPAESPAGEFTAAFRAVSADGHPIGGSITFTVATAVPDGASPPAVESAPPGAVASPVASPVPSAEEQPEAGVLAWVTGIGLIALVGALAATWVTRRTRSS